MDVILEKLNFGPAIDRIEDLGAAVKAPRVFDLWSDLTDDMLTAERRLFASERGWKDTKPSTVKRKSRDKDPRVRANAHKTNVSTGALRDHMTSKGPGAQPLHVDANELRIGFDSQSNVFYGRFQVKAGRDPRVSKRVAQYHAKNRIQQHLLSRG